MFTYTRATIKANFRLIEVLMQCRMGFFSWFFACNVLEITLRFDFIWWWWFCLKNAASWNITRGILLVGYTTRVRSGKNPQIFTSYSTSAYYSLSANICAKWIIGRTIDEYNSMKSEYSRNRIPKNCIMQEPGVEGAEITFFPNEWVTDVKGADGRAILEQFGNKINVISLLWSEFSNMFDKNFWSGRLHQLLFCDTLL